MAQDITLTQTGAQLQALINSILPPNQTSQPAGGMLPNKKYKLGVLSSDTTFSLATPTDNTIPNEYRWSFDIGSTAPTVTFPSNVIFPDGVTPVVEAGKHYEVMVDEDLYGSIIVWTRPTT